MKLPVKNLVCIAILLVMLLLGAVDIAHADPVSMTIAAAAAFTAETGLLLTPAAFSFLTVGVTAAVSLGTSLGNSIASTTLIRLENRQ